MISSIDERMNAGTITFEELSSELSPVVKRHARQTIWGFDQDDIEQELRMVLWRCFQNWDPTRTGYEGRTSSFYNYMVHAFQNMLGKMLHKSRSWNQAIESYKCSECETEVGERGKCPQCGNGRRTPIRGHVTASLDRLMELNAVAVEAEASYDPLSSLGGLESLLSELDDATKEEVLDSITMGKYLKKGTREKVRALLAV